MTAELLSAARTATQSKGAESLENPAAAVTERDCYCSAGLQSAQRLLGVCLLQVREGGAHAAVLQCFHRGFDRVVERNVLVSCDLE